MRATIPILFLAFMTACASDPSRKAAQVGDAPSATAPVVVDASIDDAVRVVNFSADQGDDGRLHIKVLLASESKSDIALLAHTDWFNRKGEVIEQGAARILMLPGGASRVYEDICFKADAQRFTVSVRPMDSSATAE
ncbi:MAG: putative periplasmic lipoprotein [Planctomycetota bacterium]|jgi:hypothetical protein